jgi:hypothetical protein
MEINDELARAIGVACLVAWYSTYENGVKHQTDWKDDGKRKDTIAIGRATYEACREIVLKEALAGPTDDECRFASKNASVSFLIAQDTLERFAGMRFASLTQPPSKREKVEAVLKRWHSAAVSGVIAEEIAAIYGDK